VKSSEKSKILKFELQLGVSEIEDITSVLGEDCTKKTIKDDDSEAGSSKKLQKESLLWKDSSLFLKVSGIALDVRHS
jgi:hypothetical protein